MHRLVNLENTMPVLKKMGDKYKRDGLIGLLEAVARRLLRFFEQSTIEWQLKPVVGGWYYTVKRILTRDPVVSKNGVKMDLSYDVFSTYMRGVFLVHSFNANIDRIAKHVDTYSDVETIDLIELGAGSGFTACYLNDSLGPEQNYIAIEANESMIEVLEQTKDLNDADFITHHRAYSASEDEVQLYLHEDFWANGTHSYLKSDASISVPATTLAQVCDEYSVDEFILFSNIEGAEFELLDSELDLLRNRCPLLIIAFHPPAGDVSKHVEYLETNGFETIDAIGDFHIFRNETSTRGRELISNGIRSLIT